MDAFYASFDKRVKEDYQCNYRSNTKEGPYTEWHRNGRMRFEGRFTRGRLNGASTDWYESGQKEAEQNWLDGQLHGRVRYWSEKGDLQFDSTFEHGMNQHRRNVSYRYLSYLPKDYEADAVRKWPLVIYLHGGSDRGTDLKKLYSSGIPDQVYRGREFPFIMLAPQCPEHLRWSTDDWFENFYKEVTARYRIDTDRVYLTGPSLGGSGTWYIAARYPEIVRGHRADQRIHEPSRLHRQEHRQAARHACLGLPREAGHGRAVRRNGADRQEARREEPEPEILRRTGYRPLDPLAGLSGPGDLRLASAIRQKIEKASSRSRYRAHHPRDIGWLIQSALPGVGRTSKPERAVRLTFGPDAE
ncbi:MAG: hypothetical protein MZW92_04255 [Comamonadaceae bacterium]|nr:hypothetical protein [Comamonadaceae bacterium]